MLASEQSGAEEDTNDFDFCWGPRIAPRGFLPTLSLAGTATFFAGTMPASSEIKRIEIDTAVAVSNDIVGAYELITGRATGAVDPNDPLNALINSIQNAPRCHEGLVEYETTFALAKPKDITKASGVLWYDIVKRSTSTVTAKPYGHVQLLSGWQGDIASNATNNTAKDPVTSNADDSPITGKVLARIVDPEHGTHTVTVALLGRAVPYDAVSLDMIKANLIEKNAEKRSGELGPVEQAATTDWAFADCSEAEFHARPDPRKLCINSASTAFLYAVVYDAKDTLVLGLRLKGMRDLSSYFRFSDKDKDKDTHTGSRRRGTWQQDGPE